MQAPATGNRKHDAALRSPPHLNAPEVATCKDAYHNIIDLLCSPVVPFGSAGLNEDSPYRPPLTTGIHCVEVYGWYPSFCQRTNNASWSAVQ